MTIRYVECITCGLPGDECQCPALGQVAGTPPTDSEAKRRALLYDRLSMAQPEDIDEVLVEAGFVLWGEDQRRACFSAGQHARRAIDAEIVRALRDDLPNSYDDVTSWQRLDDAAKAIEAAEGEPV